MLEKKSASGVHLTPKEAAANLLLNEEDEGAEEEARREEEEAEVEEEAEHRLLQQKKIAGKLSQIPKRKRSEEMEEEGRNSGCSNQGSEDQEDKITFNPGPDIPIIAGMPDAELLDEEHPTPEPETKACTALVPYSSPFRFIPSPKIMEEDGKPGIGSFCAPPGMPLSVNKHVTPKTPASLASIDLEALSPKLLPSLRPDLPDGKELEITVPKMSYPGNNAIVGFLEPKRCKSPNPRITCPPVASGEIGILFSPPGDEDSNVPNPIRISHFDPCASPVSPCSARASPFSKGVVGAAFPRLQIGWSSSHPPSLSSSRCQETESPAATPLENSVPESNPELDAHGGVSPQKTGSYMWFEDEAAARAGSIERIQTLGSPPETEGTYGVAENVYNNNNNNDDDEWEWVCPDGGWGWLVLAGSMLVNALVPGMVKSFGVLFLEFLRVFHASPLAASWIPALCYFLYSSLGPVACVLSNRFSYRTITFLGGFLAAMGLILSYFAHSITYLYLSYGVLVGAGAGLAFPPGVFIVASYFDKRRGLANGLCVSGSALGSILLPPFLRFLLVTYGYRGAVLLMGGITFHVWVGALLYHPVERHMKRVRRKDLLTLENGKSKESEKVNADNEKDAAQIALLKRSEAVPIPGQRQVFWYVGKSPGDEEEIGMNADVSGDGRKKSSTVQQQASMHRRRRRSFSPVDERPLVEVDEEEEGAAQNTVVRAKQIIRVDSAQETEGMAKASDTDAVGRKEWRSGSRQRKTSRGFAESVPEEVEDEDMAEEGNRNKDRYVHADVPGYSSQGTAPLTGSTALLGSTQSHLQHLSPKPAVLPRSLSAASYASTSTAPPPTPMGKRQPALSASLSSFRFVSSVHHGSALAALQTEGSVSVLAASTFTLRSVGQAVGWDGGFWERIRSNLLGGSSNQNVQRQRSKACNCLGKQHNEKGSNPMMSGGIISGKNMPALERICNHHSLDRKQLGQVGERKVSVASFISARDVKMPTGNIDIPRKYVDSQENSWNCTPKMNGGNLSPDSLQAQDWSSNIEIPMRDDTYAKSAYEQKDEKEGNSLLTGQFVRRGDADAIDLVSASKKPVGNSPVKKTKSKGKSVKGTKQQPQTGPKKKLFDLSLLTDSLYLILLLSNSTSAIGYTNFTILLPAWAASLGFNTSEASLLLSVVAATDLIGRIGGAALSDLRFMPRRWYYVGGLAISGVVLAFLPLFTTGPALIDQPSENVSPYVSYSPSPEAQVSSLSPFDVSGATPFEPYSSSANTQDMILNKASTSIPSVTDILSQNSSRSRMTREIADAISLNLGNGVYDEDGSKSTTVEDYGTPIIVQATKATALQSHELADEEGEETHMSSSAYLQLAAACAVFGLSSGAYVGVTAALFSDMLGPERLASSFGLSLLANGILQLAGPPLCGLALSKIPSENGGGSVPSPTPQPKRNPADILPPGPAAYAPIISTLGLFLVAGAGMWGFMPSIERKRREKEGGVMI